MQIGRDTGEGLLQTGRGMGDVVLRLSELWADTLVCHRVLVGSWGARPLPNIASASLDISLGPTIFGVQGGTGMHCALAMHAPRVEPSLVFRMLGPNQSSAVLHSRPTKASGAIKK